MLKLHRYKNVQDPGHHIQDGLVATLKIGNLGRAQNDMLPSSAGRRRLTPLRSYRSSLCLL